MKRRASTAWYFAALAPSLALLSLGSSGCQTAQPEIDPAKGDISAQLQTPAAITRPISQGVYAGQDGVFAQARRVLREQGFILDRVDAQAGVITTQPKTTAGLATPWHSDQSTAYQELEDAANRQQRTVRITFAPADSSLDPAAVTDLRDYAGELTMTVRVVVEREHRPGWRLNTTSILLSSYAVDTEMKDRGLAYSYDVPREDDQDLADTLARLIVLRSK